MSAIASLARDCHVCELPSTCTGPRGSDDLEDHSADPGPLCEQALLPAPLSQGLHLAQITQPR